MNSVYASIPGMPELGMVWMGDMMVHGEPSHELMMDPRQAESPFFTHTTHAFDDIRNHQIAPTTMVRYMPAQFPNECSEPDEAMEAVDGQDMQQVNKPLSKNHQLFIFHNFLLKIRNSVLKY